LSGNKFIGACSGDSGGPLVGTAGASRFLLGVVSFGPTTGCKATAPRVFTRVSAYAGWIVAQQSILNAQRSFALVDISRLQFVGTDSNPLPITTGLAADLRPMRTQTAGFVTESTTLPQSDIASLAVHSYTHAVGLADVSVDVVDKSAWASDGCGLGAATNTSGTATVCCNCVLPRLLRWGRGRPTLNSAMSQTQVTASRPRCAGADHWLQRSSIPAQCNAGIGWTSDHQLQFSLTRQCFRNPQAAYLRVQQLTADVWDVEPGTDLWAGPFNASEPTVG